MSKIQQINKLIYSFIFSSITMLSIIIEYDIILDSNYIIDLSNINFLNQFFWSLKEFDIIYITIWVLLFYFYLQVFFKQEQNKKQIIISIIIAIILSFLTTYLKIKEGTILFNYYLKIFKIIIYLTGNFLIIYAIILKIININIKKNILKHVEKYKK